MRITLYLPATSEPLSQFCLRLPVRVNGSRRQLHARLGRRCVQRFLLSPVVWYQGALGGYQAAMFANVPARLSRRRPVPSVLMTNKLSSPSPASSNAS